MTDETGARAKTGLEVATALVKEIPVYQDLAQPAVREAGIIVATPLRLIRTALRPIESIIRGTNHAFDRLDRRIEEKFKDEPPEKIVEPLASIAGPLMLNYPFFEEQEPVRDLFDELLASAMHKDKRADVHPSFVDIVTQLSSDEARLLHWLATSTTNHLWPIARAQFGKDETFSSYLRGPLVWPSVDKAGLEEVKRLQEYLDNLIRLRIVEIPENGELTEGSGYDAIAASQSWKNLASAVEAQGHKLRMVRTLIRCTLFGERFLRACVKPNVLLERSP